ncbi:AlpA family transcriptional regulator [Roseovarius sp. M141]|uniref:helix-turn-helix transcriptional regulator n=1 Tax=Roseovarius sp. M141 TaxID=2583806 RepID=UPI0020CD3FE1|nr:helix-turn-helix domain-containing protein [Roseovarius sp. M141]MCQ0090922.1 helix-turn-helix domain-containing protein [Roseovarius sp. M141]MCQ0094238.1 helix-turn-helix domain-containing protein [Roseovarius sp. M141]MCQ0094245.1 helix-turn-helix domain-containing protein [Roseovarius sp. M141]
MIQSQTEPETTATALLSGWISRKDLADALGVTVDTLGRWEARRVGPPCVRAGRMVLYRRRAVEDWLAAQEMPRAKTAGGRR